MLQKFYDRAFVFLKLVEQEYASLGQSCSEWESLHLRFLLYYLIRFKIKSDRDFSLYHFRTAYRLYLDKLLQDGTTFIQ
ncbi:sigma(X)-activator ComW [Streptococcus sp. 27098_8_23]|uniref:sigma(X)-activator ComW n=2 Tax=Bacillota TaxID=1239 RepID=UPI0008A52FE6|nr:MULTISPECIES: sigma(X)-activator ComW [unclassified Streptococcus]OFL51148.1 recombination protein RecX [Streptococcus sp. HMSC076C08]QCZ56877.1 recombination protein RecX [Streptococcus sp. 1643]